MIERVWRQAACVLLMVLSVLAGTAQTAQADVSRDINWTITYNVAVCATVNPCTGYSEISATKTATLRTEQCMPNINQGTQRVTFNNAFGSWDVIICFNADLTRAGAFVTIATGHNGQVNCDLGGINVQNMARQNGVYSGNQGFGSDCGSSQVFVMGEDFQLLVAPGDHFAIPVVKGPVGGPFAPSPFNFTVKTAYSTVNYNVSVEYAPFDPPGWVTVCVPKPACSSTSVEDIVSVLPLTVPIKVENSVATHLTSGLYGAWIRFRNLTREEGDRERYILLAVAPGARTHDINKDGKSDITWRDASGAAAIWFMNGGSVQFAGGMGQVPNAWQIVGQRDLNQDGKSDLLWRHTTTGDVAIWLMSGTNVLQSAAIGNVPPAWSVVGTGDFDGDARGDILWRNTSTGDVAIWLMNGTTVSRANALANVPIAWSVAAVGDFNGDGTTDILWRNTPTGDVAIWFMNGTTVSQSVSVGNVSTAWSIVATGDFNGDGKNDLLWRDSAGTTAVWLMNGSAVVGGGSLGVVPSAWTIANTGDYNGDGKSDILWRNTSTGDTAMWFMNGTAVTSAVSVANVPTSWTVQSANAN